jgi:hypothetical protein
MNQIPKILVLAQNIRRIIKSHFPGCRAMSAAILTVALVVLPWPARALIINATYDTSVTEQPNEAQIEAAYGLVVTNLETLYTNAITVNITVYWANVGLGESQTEFYEINSYSSIISALAAAATTPEDHTAAASLPASDPTGGANWYVPSAEVKALTQLANEYGINPNDPQTDGMVYFASNGVTWTFSPTNRAPSSGITYDFIAVAEHETTEAMGRVPGLNVNGFYVPYDLFRFTGGGRSLSASDTGVYFSLNDGVKELKPFNSVPGGDLQDWMPTNLPDSFDWELYNNTEGYLSSEDLTAMDVLGYHLNFHPPKLSGTRLANGNFDLTFTNVTGMGFSVWASTNLLTPATNWVNLGQPGETSAGHYQLIDTSANKYRFYRVLLQ